MPTTVDLDDDVAAAVERLRREQGLGLSQAVNALARRGVAPSARPDYVVEPVTFDLGLTLDVSDTARALELLDDLAAPRLAGGALTGPVRVGIPWQTVGAFVRIVTHPRAARGRRARDSSEPRVSKTCANSGVMC